MSLALYLHVQALFLLVIRDMLFKDISAAFDCAYYCTLIKVLHKSLGISGTLPNWSVPYLCCLYSHDVPAQQLQKSSIILA